MKAKLESATAALVGLPLWASGRAADLQWFQFGERRTVTTMRGDQEVGELALHVQCPWRIVRADAIVTGHRDLFYPGDETAEAPDDFDYNGVVTRRDKRVATLFTGGIIPIVRTIDVGEAAALRIALDGGYTLELFPCSSTIEEDWRLFRPYSEADDIVICGGALEL